MHNMVVGFNKNIVSVCVSLIFFNFHISLSNNPDFIMSNI